MRSGTWVIVLPGVYRAAVVPTNWHQTVLAVCLWCRGVASHSTACRIWGLDGFSGDLIEVISKGKLDCPLAGVVVHRNQLEAVDRTTLGPIPVTQPWRSLLDAAGTCDEALLEMALESALRKKLVTSARLRWALDRLGRRGRNGAGPFRRLLDERDPSAPPTDSAMELRAMRLLRAAKQPPPVPQYPVLYKGSRYRIDLAYPRLKIAIELDGRRYHSNSPAFQGDRTKQNALVALGWMPLRFTYDDVYKRPKTFTGGVPRL